LHPDRTSTTNIQLLRSAVASKRPTPATLLDGQVAVNTNAAEPGLFFKLSDNTLTKVGPASYSTSGAAPNSSPSGSAGNGVGEEWFDGRNTFASPVLKLWNGSSWLTASGFTVNDTTGDYSIAKSLAVNSLTASGVGNESHITVPSDTTTNRPGAPISGMIRFNSTTSLFEGYDGVNWDSFVTAGANGSFVDLNATGDITLGDSCVDDTLTITAVTTVNCNMVIGVNNTTTVGFGSLISTDIIPNLDVQRNLGSPGARWANIYTGDLHLKNDRGDWTMIEEEDFLSLRNNTTGKTFKISMEPVD